MQEQPVAPAEIRNELCRASATYRRRDAVTGSALASRVCGLGMKRMDRPGHQRRHNKPILVVGAGWRRLPALTKLSLAEK
jgi:hypothetical protein